MEEQHPQVQGNNTDYKLIDVLEKKQENIQDDALMVDLQTKDNNEDGHRTLMAELQRTRSHSSSSSEEEIEEGGERKKRKKKGLKDKIKEKFAGENGSEANDQQTETLVDIEEHNEVGNQEEKKGFLDKIKEKLPGHHKPTEQGTATTSADEQHSLAEKKGILEKIKEKLPGQHKNQGDDTQNKKSN